MKEIVALLLGFAAAWNEEYTLEEVEELDTLSTFREWAHAFKREYSNITEEASKYSIWLDNLYKIGETNSENLSYKFGLNQFSDMSTDEFIEYVGINVMDEMDENDKKMEALLDESLSLLYESVPTSVDWTTKGVVTPVKNQGNCGSCWAFAAVCAMECGYAIKYGNLTSLSEQEMVDCDKGSMGCKMGSSKSALGYAYSVGGLCTETRYPYTARDGTCKDKSCGKHYDTSVSPGYVPVTSNNEAALTTAVASSCVAVYVDANSAWQHYKSGILTASCGTQTNHVVTAVGYGESGSQQYWKIKNSWGTTWGEQGYMLICKACNKNGNKGECGINTYAFTAKY